MNLDFSNMNDSQDILDQLRRRPALYTGEASLSSIEHFLSGYSFAANRYNVGNPDDRLLIPREFHDWVAYRLHFYESTSGWCHMIVSKSESDDVAIERFFILLDQLHQREAHIVARLTGYQKKYTRTTYRQENNTLIEDSTATRSYPDSIRLVTYKEDPGFFAYSETDDELPVAGFFPTIELFEILTGANRNMLTILDPKWLAET
jgi:hypothetical protein